MDRVYQKCGVSEELTNFSTCAWCFFNILTVSFSFLFFSFFLFVLRLILVPIYIYTG
ncbi:hypothetical protein BDV26DRAFT_256718, partial [Aspergillus bertholletiae]